MERRYIVGSSVAGVVIVAALGGFLIHQHDVASNESSTAVQVVVASPSPSATDVSPSPSPTPTATASPDVSPSPSPTPTATATTLLNAKASATVKGFYTAYKNKDSKALLVDTMTSPTTDDEREVQSLLWMGKDLKGVEGGPTLFVSTIAGDVVQDYTVISSEKSGEVLKVTVKEHVMFGDQKSERQRIIEIANNGDGAINRYLTLTSSGKYSGFLN